MSDLFGFIWICFYPACRRWARWLGCRIAISQLLTCITTGERDLHLVHVLDVPVVHELQVPVVHVLDVPVALVVFAESVLSVYVPVPSVPPELSVEGFLTRVQVPQDLHIGGPAEPHPRQVRRRPGTTRTSSWCLAPGCHLLPLQGRHLLLRDCGGGGGGGGDGGGVPAGEEELLHLLAKQPVRPAAAGLPAGRVQPGRALQGAAGQDGPVRDAAAGGRGVVAAGQACQGDGGD